MTNVSGMDQFLDGKKAKSYNNKVLFVCALLAAIESMDIYVLGVIIKPMSTSFDVTLKAFAIVFLFQAIGQGIGNYLIAPLADKYGRRPVILYCTAIFGILTVTSAWSTDLTTFIAQRCVAAIFIGGSVPNMFAISSEFASGKSKHRNALLVGSSHGLGAGLAALMGGFLLSWGWQAPLIACGVLTLLSAVMAYFFLPESIRFLAADGHRDAELKRLVAKIDPSVDVTRLDLNTFEPASEKLRMSTLFQPGLRTATLLLWLIGGISLALLSSIAQWLPTYIHTYGGVDLKTAAYMTSLNGFAGVAWPIVLIGLMHKFGISRSMAINYSLAALTIGSFALVTTNANIGWVVAIGFGAFLGGATSGFYALCNSVYPTKIRATGASFAVGAGRVTSLFVPLLGGWAVTSGVSAGSISIALVIPLLVAMLAALALQATLNKTSTVGTGAVTT